VSEHLLSDAVAEAVAEQIIQKLYAQIRESYQPDEGLSPAAVAKMLGIKESTVRNVRSTDPDFPRKLPGGVYSRRAIEKWMELRSWPQSRRRTC
jgi:predicted DNA-binding transcriptional regulator AlpA